MAMRFQQRSDWRRRARQVIDEAVRQAREQGLDGPATLKLIDAAYPFGQRKMWPYQKWLEERRATIEELRLPTARRPFVVYRCNFCKDKGCLACATPINGGTLPPEFYTGGPRDTQAAPAQAARPKRQRRKTRSGEPSA